MYKNKNINNALIVVFEQMKAYFSACVNDKNRMPAIENAISKYMLPRVEAYIVDDIMAGGEHTFKTIENKGQPILLVDNVAFCNYTASEGWGLLQKYDCPLNKDYHLINEGKKTADIINDFCSMDVKAFAKKHYVPVPIKNTDVLIRHLATLYRAENFRTDEELANTKNLNSNDDNIIYASEVTFVKKSNEKTVFGKIKFEDRIKFALLQFFNANPSYFHASYEGGIFTINNRKTEGRIEAEVGFGRNNNFSDFELRVLYLNIYISKNGTNSEHLDIKIELPDNCKAELGKIFTRTTYPRYAEKFKENKEDYVSKPIHKAENNDIVVEMEDGTTITMEASNPIVGSSKVTKKETLEDGTIITEFEDDGTFDPLTPEKINELLGLN